MRSFLKGLAVCFSVILAIFLWLAPMNCRPVGGERRASCQSNLKQLGLACIAYQKDHGHLPEADRWTHQLLPYYKNPQLLICCSDIHRPIGYAMNVKLSGMKMNLIDHPGTTVLFYDAMNGRTVYRHVERRVWRRQVCNAAMVDGRVWSYTPREMQRFVNQNE